MLVTERKERDKTVSVELTKSKREEEYCLFLKIMTELRDD